MSRLRVTAMLAHWRPVAVGLSMALLAAVGVRSCAAPNVRNQASLALSTGDIAAMRATPLQSSTGLLARVVAARLDDHVDEELLRVLVDGARPASAAPAHMHGESALARSLSLPLLPPAARVRVEELAAKVEPNHPDASLALALMGPADNQLSAVAAAVMSASFAVHRFIVLAAVAIDHERFDVAAAAAEGVLAVQPNHAHARVLAALASASLAPQDVDRSPALKRLSVSSADGGVQAEWLTGAREQLGCVFGASEPQPSPPPVDADVRQSLLWWRIGMDDRVGARALSPPAPPVDAITLHMAVADDRPAQQGCGHRSRVGLGWVEASPWRMLPFRVVGDTRIDRALLDPPTAPSAYAAIHLAERAVAAEQKGDVEGARTLLKQALAQHAEHAWPHLAAGVLEARHGGASSVPFAAAAERAQHPLLLGEVAWWSARAGQVAAARTALDRMGKTTTALGIAARGLVDLDMAAVNKAVQLAPDDARVRSARFAAQLRTLDVGSLAEVRKASTTLPVDPMGSSEQLSWRLLGMIDTERLVEATAERNRLPIAVRTGCSWSIVDSAIAGADIAQRKRAVSAHRDALRTCKGPMLLEAKRIQARWIKI